MKFARLWIPLEMLAKRCWASVGQEPPSRRHGAGNPAKPASPATMDYVWGFVDVLRIPGNVRVPLDDMYWARNVLVHGDPDAAEQKMCGRFEYLARARREKLSGPLFPGGPELHPARLPDPSSYAMCLYVAAEMLSRLLEKIFLSLFDCRETYFHGTAPSHKTIGPWV